jgi:hypothetical protein
VKLRGRVREKEREIKFFEKANANILTGSAIFHKFFTIGDKKAAKIIVARCRCCESI